MTPRQNARGSKTGTSGEQPDMTERSMESLLAELSARGLVQTCSEGVEAHLEQRSVTVYAGFDPTAESLHVGSLVPLLSLARLQRAGHRPIALVGGGTGMIGDPSGKTRERQLLSREQVETNVAGIRRQLEQFLDFSGDNAALLIDNHEWLASLGLIDFLRDIGKSFTVNYMLAKESVSRRLEQEEGLSVTEFSYMLLQAYDFLVLSDREDCTLQIGGSDQWGNITAGIELIRKVRGRAAHGIVFPLITTSSGEKFGKTEAGTIWLDPSRTSPYRFYQFWLNTDDRDVDKYLRLFTFIPVAEIEQIVADHEADPAVRTAQRRLAIEVTRMLTEWKDWSGRSGRPECCSAVSPRTNLRPPSYSTSLRTCPPPSCRRSVWKARGWASGTCSWNLE